MICSIFSHFKHFARIFVLHLNNINQYLQVIQSSGNDGLVFVSTIDGYLRAIEPHSGTVKWSIKEGFVLNISRRGLIRRQAWLYLSRQFNVD